MEEPSELLLAMVRSINSWEEDIKKREAKKLRPSAPDREPERLRDVRSEDWANVPKLAVEQKKTADNNRIVWGRDFLSRSPRSAYHWILDWLEQLEALARTDFYFGTTSSPQWRWSGGSHSSMVAHKFAWEYMTVIFFGRASDCVDLEKALIDYCKRHHVLREFIRNKIGGGGAVDRSNATTHYFVYITTHPRDFCADDVS